MKLKFFNPEIVAEPKKAPECHLVIRKNGTISLTKPSLEQLNLKEGIKIEFCQDEDKGDWYLFKSDKGFKLKSVGQQIGFSCVKMADILWTKKAAEEKSVSMLIQPIPINDNGIDYHLITPLKKS